EERPLDAFGKNLEVIKGKSVAPQKSDVNYFTFGMTMPGDLAYQGSDYRYGFQGQETDKEWLGGSAVSFKYRVHDARIGRFLSVDPLAPDYPFYSPYAFSGNRVNDRIELEGLEPGQTILHEDQPVRVVTANDAYSHIQMREIHPNSDVAFKLESGHRQMEAEQRHYDYVMSFPVIDFKNEQVWIRNKLIYDEDWLNGSNDVANYGGKYGGEYGYHNGGKQLLFGTWGVILSGGTLYIAGAAMGGGTIALEGISLAASADDFSTVFFEKNKTLLSETLGIDPEVLNTGKSIANTGQFLKNLYKVVNNAVTNPKATDDAIEIGTLALEEIQVMIDAFEEQQAETNSTNGE
ncbi:RHS repeat-associated core domain-containing protein, partial [Halocola ammonii]